MTSRLAELLWISGALLMASGCSENRPASPPAPPRQSIVTAGVHIGAALLRRRMALEDGRLGRVTDLKWGRSDPNPAVVLVVAGTQAALFLDAAGRVRAETRFASDVSFPHTVVDVDGDGACEFLEDPAVGVLLRGHGGETRWSAHASPCAPGDLDGDGRIEFACGGGFGVEVFDGSGARRFKTSIWGTVGDARITSGVSPMRVVAVESGHVFNYDQTGKKVSSHVSAIGQYFAEFSLVRYPEPDSPERLLVSHSGKLWLLTLDGATVVATLPSPSPISAPLKALAVRINPGRAYLAVTGEILDQGGQLVGIGSRRAVLYVFDSAGTLVYHEILPRGGCALTAIPAEYGREKLLLGSENRVWEYSARK